jgi:hypothetical protein
VILFALQEEGVCQSSAVPSEIDIAVGVLALIAAALAGSGMVSPLQVGWRSRVPRLAHAAVESESDWIAWVTGVVVGLPFLYLLAAVAAVLDAGVERDACQGGSAVRVLEDAPPARGGNSGNPRCSVSGDPGPEQAVVPS